MDKSTLKQTIGIVGIGQVAVTHYLPTLFRMGFKNIWLCDSDKNRLHNVSQKYKCQVGDFEKVVKNVNTLIIATPPESHESLLMESMGKVKHIVCEKPFLLSTEAYYRILESSILHKTKVSIAHIRRIFASTLLAKEWIEENKSTQLKKATIIEGGIFHYKSASGYVYKSTMGGVLPDTGSHSLDTFLFLTGMTNNELHFELQNIEKDHVEPAHEVRAKFLLQGIQVELHLSRYNLLMNAIKLEFDTGLLFVPLDLKSRISFFDFESKKWKYFVSNNPVNYTSEAFKLELEAILCNNEDKFDIVHFRNTTFLLEKLWSSN